MIETYEEQAYYIGLLPHEFFNLTLKEFKKLATARHKRITDDRRVAEYHSALICAVLANINRPKNGKRFKPTDFMSREKKKKSTEELLEALKYITAVTNGEDKTKSR